ncbi:hypothetical protein N2152v2_010802 [Parachlorella kessleri]
MGQTESVPAQEEEPLVSDHGASPSALVIVGPSGVGKGTLIQKLMEGRVEFGFSCSHTTRAPREGEKDGVHYHFTTKKEFEKGIADGKFLEYAYVHNNIYGTSLEAVEAVAAAGKCCVLDIDVQGARQVRKSALPAIFVFIAPPSMEELERRLRARGTEKQDQVATRLKNASQEMASLQEPGLYDMVITNNKLEEALEELKAVAARALAGETGGPLTAKAGSSASGTPTAAAAEEPHEEEEEAQQEAPAKASFRGWLRGKVLGPRPEEEEEEEEEEEQEEEGDVKEQAGETAEEEAAAAPVAAPAPLQRWSGKVVLVTGAASGVGWAISIELARAGARVVAISRRKSALEDLQQTVVEAGVPIAEFLPVVCDVTKEAEVVALPRIIAKRWPGSGVEGVVNCAAVVRGGASLLDGSTASWVEMASTNVLGVAMVTRESVQDMARRGAYGHVINLCCLDGHYVAEAGEGNGFYAATKHAVRAMTEALRQEARAKGLPLRVTCVSPGPIDSPFHLGRSFGGGGGPSSEDEPAATLGGQLSVEDVVRTLVWILDSPEHVDVNEIVMRALPRPQEAVGGDA